MTDILLFILATVLVNNIVTSHVLGIDPALAFHKRQDVAKGVSFCLLLMLPLSTAACYLVQHYLLIPLQLEYLQLPLFVSLIILLAWLLKIGLPRLHRSWSDHAALFLPLAGVNVTLLGTVLLNLQAQHPFFYSLLFGIATALGFAVIMLVLTPVTERLEGADVPQPFRGLSIHLITLGVLSMAFMGFAGLLTLS